jgi:hypothetical protein
MTADAGPVTVTAVCEAGRCHLCRGTVVSLTAPAGQQCECPAGCHDRGGPEDMAIERDLEAAHWEEII